jgi:hypothetical protein
MAGEGTGAGLSHRSQLLAAGWQQNQRSAVTGYPPKGRWHGSEHKDDKSSDGWMVALVTGSAHDDLGLGLAMVLENEGNGSR